MALSPLCPQLGNLPRMTHSMHPELAESKDGSPPKNQEEQETPQTTSWGSHSPHLPQVVWFQKKLLGTLNQEVYSLRGGKLTSKTRLKFPQKSRKNKTRTLRFSLLLSIIGNALSSALWEKVSCQLFFASDISPRSMTLGPLEGGQQLRFRARTRVAGEIPAMDEHAEAVWRAKLGNRKTALCPACGEPEQAWVTSRQITPSCFRPVIVPTRRHHVQERGDVTNPSGMGVPQPSLEVEWKHRKQAWKLENHKMRRETERSLASRWTYKYNQNHQRPLTIFLPHSVTELRVTPCVP